MKAITMRRFSPSSALILSATCLLPVTGLAAAEAPGTEPIRIACLGDSITAGARVDAATQSYPVRLQELLGDGYEVRNLGLGGATLIKTGRPNIWQKLDDVREFQPHVAVISLGTNDTVGGQRKNWEKIGRFEDDYSELIGVLAAIPTRPRIVVCTPTAMVLQTKGLSEQRSAELAERKPRLQQLCRRIRDLAGQHAKENVSLLDLNAVLRDRPDLISEGDGVHPNADGYLAIARAVAEPCRIGKPRMHFADTVSGRPFSKDPAVVRFRDRYWLYYSLPPYEGKATPGWSIGIATSDNLVDWTKAAELRNSGEAERNGFCAPGAIVLEGKVRLFYQTYGNRQRDAICHAWSEDGIHFIRDPSNPVFRPAGAWNCGRAIDADVIEHEDRLLLYWATRDPAFTIQSQGVAAAPLDSDFARDKWAQLNPDGPILEPKLGWEGRCIEAAAMARREGRLFMFYAGGYNNSPQQVGVAVSDDGVHFERMFTEPLLPNGPAGSWNSSESGHPFLFQDDDGQDYLFYQGNDDGGRSWYLSVVPVEWRQGRPVLAPRKLPR